MWPVIIKFFTKDIKLALLCGNIACRWPRCFCFQGAVHSLMPTILLRLAWLN